MKHNWLFFAEINNRASACNCPRETFSSPGSGRHNLEVDNSNYKAKHLLIPGSLVLEEAFNRISKFAGTLLLWLRRGQNQNVEPNLSSKPHELEPRDIHSCITVKNSGKHEFLGFCSGSISRLDSSIPMRFGKIAHSTLTHIWKELEQLQSFPALSLAAALVPPFDNLSRNVLAMPLGNSNILIEEHMNQTACICPPRDLSFHDVNRARQAVEPQTGIEFPTVLDMLDGANNSNVNSEVLVGTGSKGMKIFKVKALKVYAFGLYVQPKSICKRLGRKYASVPVGELNDQPEFFDDLLREDIHMTVRLVVNCNGVKLSAVRDAFEKSLRARLVKANPNTDYKCLTTFDTYFSEDIALPPGTTINFQRTTDGQLVTEIGGKKMGAVHSKDLCRAFFGMYIGDLPVSLQAKEEIARNVGGIIKRC
ncbi:hypothetical protein ACHQM5_001658 [Ranunculus cassubicifolius]